MLSRRLSRLGVALPMPRPTQTQTQQHLRRITTKAVTAQEAADQLKRTFYGKTITRKQILDGNQLQKLSLTLGRTHLWPDLDVTRGSAPVGTPLPPGYHLVYFTPSEMEMDLGPDGSDRTFNPPAPFTRRMWAGGRMQWFDVPLRIGERVEEHTRLVSSTVKKSRDGSEMVLVEVEKEFWGERGPSTFDQRAWIYRREVEAKPFQASGPVQPPTPAKSSVQDVTASDPEAFLERHLSWSPAALFRFSALTFNAHMIHYNEGWTRNVEGHPNVVVHGPLNLVCMADYWRDVHSDGSPYDVGRLNEITYRATAPIYAGEEYTITSSVPEEGGAVGTKGLTRQDISIRKAGTVCMTAECRAGRYI